MDAAFLMSETFTLIGALSPFVFAFVVIAYADELIDLIKRAAGVKHRRRYD